VFHVFVQTSTYSNARVIDLPSHCPRERDIGDRCSRWWWRWRRQPAERWSSRRDRNALPRPTVWPAALAPRRRVPLWEELVQWRLEDPPARSTNQLTNQIRYTQRGIKNTQKYFCA